MADEQPEPDDHSEEHTPAKERPDRPARQRGMTAGEMAATLAKAGVVAPQHAGLDAAARAMQNMSTSALRKAGLIESPLQQAMRNLKSFEHPLAAYIRKTNALHTTQALAWQKVIGAGAAESALKAIGARAILAQSPALSGLDLRHLMPGAALGRSEAFRVAALGESWVRLATSMERLDPANWRGERLNRVDMLLVLEDGIPLVWAPSADVIRALVEEKDPVARRKVLEGRAATVVEDCRSVLDDITRDDLTAQTDFLRSCLGLLEGEHHAAAQAMATSVLDTVLRAMVRADPSLQNNQGGFTFKNVAKGMPRATTETTLGQFRAYCLHTSVHTAYASYFGPPVPKEYNRNATAHGAGPTQFTLANALAAVLLAVGLLRELEETQREISPAD